MATHILSSFSIKKRTNLKFIGGLIANDSIIIKSIYFILPPLFLMTDFNLLWGKLHRRDAVLLEGSRPILVPVPT